MEENEFRMMAVGSIGAGFSTALFERGLSWNPHVVASDAGSADHGAAASGFREHRVAEVR